MSRAPARRRRGASGWVGAAPAGVLIALDRMERGQGERSAVREVQETFGIPVVAIATLDDVMTFIAGRSDLTQHASAVATYRAQYGARDEPQEDDIR